MPDTSYFNIGDAIFCIYENEGKQYLNKLLKTLTKSKMERSLLLLHSLNTTQLQAAIDRFHQEGFGWLYFTDEINGWHSHLSRHFPVLVDDVSVSVPESK